MRETKRKIRNIEEEMDIIAQEMLEERTDHNRKKDLVKQKIADTSGELNKCRQTNILKKKEVDALQEEWIEKEAANTGLEETIARIEESCMMMGLQKEGLEDRLSVKIEEHAALVRQGAAIAVEHHIKGKEAEANRARLGSKIEEIQKLYDKNKKKLDALESECDNLKAELSKAAEMAAEEKAKEEELHRKLNELRSELANASSEVTRLAQENQDMEREIEDVKEAHAVTTEELRDNLNDLNQQYEVAATQRQQYQEERNHLLRQIDDFKANYASTIHEATERIGKGKQKHEKLTKEGQELTKALKDLDQDIKEKKEGTMKAKEGYRVKKQELETKLTTLKERIAVTEVEIEKRAETDAKETPAFENLEKEFETKTEGFVTLKNHVVEQKEYAGRLEDDIDATKESEEKLRQPTVELKDRVQVGRTECLELMEKQQGEMEELEKDVYLLGCQLQTVMEENARFQNGIDALNGEEEELEKEATANTR